MSTSTSQLNDRFWWCVLAAALVLLPCASALGQEPGGRQVYNEELRTKLDKQIPGSQEKSFDAGGWFTFAIFNYDDPVAARHRMLRRYQLRGWASLNLQGVHRAYFRGLLNLEDWNTGDNPVTGRGNDEFHERVERAWYQFDLGKMLRNQSGQAPPVDFRMKAGRQFVRIGTALTLSMPLDAIKFNVDAGDWEFKAFLGKTVMYMHNIDQSDPVAYHHNRCMFGVEVAYRGLSDHRPFVYYLDNKDHTSKAEPDPDQSYDYTSRYVGIGSEGTLLLPDLRYRIEMVGEWGKTFSEGVTSGRDRICAFGMDAALAYFFRKTPTRPKIMFEYLYGSGDGNRRLSSSSTLGGNRAGTQDHAFNAFGFRDTGVALAPRISNLHIYIFGVSFFPLESCKFLRNLEVGSKVFFYHKSEASGAISDLSAINGARWVGWEWDLFCNWRITSDLAWTLRYGAFQPGSAYNGGDKTCRQFLYTGMVYSF